MNESILQLSLTKLAIGWPQEEGLGDPFKISLGMANLGKNQVWIVPVPLFHSVANIPPPFCESPAPYEFGFGSLKPHPLLSSDKPEQSL